MKKIGLIGFGKIAAAHQKAFDYLKTPIQFSVNRSETGRQKALDAGIARVYADMHEAIQTENPDGLVVCVGFEQLYEVMLELIPSGIPILLEKPSGTSLQEHQALVDLSQKFGNKVQLAVNRRFYSIFHRALEDMGGRDNLTAVDIEWSERPTVLRERGMSEQSIAKILYGNSIHGLDMLSWLAGKFEDIQVQTYEFNDLFRWQIGVLGRSETNVLFTYRASWDNPVPWRLVLSSKDKRYTFAPLEQCTVQTPEGSYQLEPLSEDLEMKPGFVAQSRAFLEMVEGAPSAVPIADASESMWLAEEIFKKVYER